MRLYKPLLITLMMYGLTGCANNSLFVNYPSQLASARAQLDSATPNNAASKLAEGINSKDGLLYAQEAGRAAQINGDFAGSLNYYKQAIAAYTEFDNKATVSLSEIGSQGSSIVLNDNAIPYRGPGYERIMLHQYQALNYLFSNDIEGALVEVRRSNELQKQEQERYEKSNEDVKAISNGKIDAEVNKLDQAAGGITSSFLNAYSYYTTGLLYELTGQRNDAFIDYRKAAQIMPNNPYLQQDLVRLAKQLSMPQYADFKKRWGDAVYPTSDQGQLVVIVEKGFVPEKRAITIPFKIRGNWQSASVPTYLPNNVFEEPVTISGLSKPLTAAPIANIDALAITALKEDLPYILTRQAARIYAKSELAQSVDKKGKGSDLAVFAVQLFNVVSEQADRRSWLTLPKQAQIAREFINNGSYTLSLGSSSTTVQVETNKTTLVWAINTGNVTHFYTKLL